MSWEDRLKPGKKYVLAIGTATEQWMRTIVTVVEFRSGIVTVNDGSNLGHFRKEWICGAVEVDEDAPESAACAVEEDDE